MGRTLLGNRCQWPGREGLTLTLSAQGGSFELTIERDGHSRTELWHSLELVLERARALGASLDLPEFHIRTFGVNHVSTHN